QLQPISTLFPYTTLFRSDKYRALVLFLSHWTSFFYSWGKLVSMRTHLGVMYPKEFINKDMATTYKLYLHTDNIVVDREELYKHRSEEHTSELQSRFDLVC